MPIPSLKIGLIGAGRIGHLHAEHLTTRIPSADVLMVADAFEETARQCAESFAIASFTRDYRVVFDRPDIEAVVICTSTDTHARIIEEAAQAGKHMFCDEPIALEIESIDRALNAVTRAGVKLQRDLSRGLDASSSRARH